MKFCPHCGKELSVQSSFCPHCGETLVGKTNNFNMSIWFWVKLIGSFLLVILSFRDWVTISIDDIGLNLFSLLGKLSDIEDYGLESQEFILVQLFTGVMIILLILSFVLLLVSFLKQSHDKSKFALYGFGINAFVMIVFIALISLSNNSLSDDLFGYTFKLFYLENSPYIMLVISVFEIILMFSTKQVGANSLNNITSADDDEFSGQSRLKNVTIANNVTNIGKNAFCNCKGLTSVIIPSSVISIGNGAFCECKGLSSIVIPNSVTSIGNIVFSNCTRLENITLSDNITSIGDGLFSHCEKLKNIVIPDSVVSIGSSAFWECTGLISIKIPSNVTSIGDNAFCGCTGLTSIAIPDSVTSIGDNAFWDCKNLTEVSYKGKSYSVSPIHEFSGWFYDLPDEFYNAVNES